MLTSNLYQINKQLADAQAAWHANIGNPAIQKLQLYQPNRSVARCPFVATGADAKFVYITECIREVFAPPEYDEFVYHKVPTRYLSMTDAQILAERRADDLLLDGIDRAESAKRYHARKHLRVRQSDVDPDPFNDYGW